MPQVLERTLSKYNGKRIKVVAQCLERKSKNAKTGDMIQIGIIPDTKKSMFDIVNNGFDESTCGDCPLRPIHAKALKAKGLKPCYVNVHKSINSVHRSTIGKATDKNLERLDKEKAKGRPIRWGNWGDPALVSKALVQRVNAGAKGSTGYTHQHKKPWARWAKRFFMASIDVAPNSLKEAKKAWAKGWRTFRLVRSIEELDHKSEILCPASKEAGNKTTCAKCLLCDGKRSKNDKRKSIAIIQH